MFFDNYFTNVSKKKQYQTRDLMLVNNISNLVLAVTNLWLSRNLFPQLNAECRAVEPS